MRLIDAEKIEIPASMIYRIFGCYMIRVEDVQRIISDQPVAFDKEKVIEELVELRQSEYNDADEESETMDGEEIYDEGRSQGRLEAYCRAIELVEKGGIE